MIIERTKDEIIIRLPGDIDIDELQDMKDWLEYTEVARKSKAKQKDVDSLVKEIKKGRWEKREKQLLK
jgi:anti-anti-sigma regulatory factor